MKKLPQIKVYHQFLFNSTQPGVVTCKEFSDSNSVDFNISKIISWNPVATDLPPVLTPKGLSADRQWYLYEKIRPYCDNYSDDIVCPLPSTSRPTPTNTPVNSPIRSGSSSRTHHQSSINTPPPKRVRSCSKCGGSGHNTRTCKQ